MLRISPLLAALSYLMSASTPTALAASTSCDTNGDELLNVIDIVAMVEAVVNPGSNVTCAGPAVEPCDIANNDNEIAQSTCDSAGGYWDTETEQCTPWLTCFQAGFCGTPAGVTSSPSPEPAPLTAYSGDSCPALTAGTNTIEAAGSMRQVQIIMPDEPHLAGVAFAWHGLGGNANAFASTMDATNIAASEHLIVVVPTPDYQPLTTFPPTWRLVGDPGPDLTLFDDVLACLENQYDIDNSRVYTTGFSAGGLWSTRLVIERAQTLAAATIWSGGTGAGGLLEVSYSTPDHTLPVLVAWGGPGDQWSSSGYTMDFNAGSLDFSQNLVADGHHVMQCDHQGGHSIPSGGPEWGWHFMTSQQFGDEANESSNLFPSYCVVLGADDNQGAGASNDIAPCLHIQPDGCQTACLDGLDYRADLMALSTLGGAVVSGDDVMDEVCDYVIP